MSMHLEGPWLSLNGRRKGRVKFRNAEEARRARELAEEWERNQARWNAMSRPTKPAKSKKPEPKVTNSSGFTSHSRSDQPQSLNEWVTGAVNTKEIPKYTGSKILGIGTMHKSNAVPIFSDQEAVDISTMRRN